MEICETASPEAVQVLDELDRAHALFGTYRRLGAALRKMGRRADRPLRVLDAGCGTGGFLFWAAAQGTAPRARWRLLGLDRSAVAIDRARTRASTFPHEAPRFVCGSLSDLEDGAADVVVSSFVLHHLDGPNLADWMRQVRRIARLGTVQLDFTTPHSRLSRWVWQSILKGAGFSAPLREDGMESLARAWPPGTLADAARAAGWQPRWSSFAGLCVQLTAEWHERMPAPDG